MTDIINPALRERAEIILESLSMEGSIQHRLAQLLRLSDVDLDVLFTQRMVDKFQKHNAFDRTIEMLEWRVPYDGSKIAPELKTLIIKHLEAANWKGAIALIIKALDNGL